MSDANTYTVIAIVNEGGEEGTISSTFDSCRDAWSEANNMVFVYGGFCQIFENDTFLTSIS